MGKIAILGAAGATGKAVARELARRAETVRTVGRHAQRLEAAFGSLPVERLAADLETTDGAAAAVEGVDTAVMTLGLPYTDFRRYPALMRNVVEASERAGVRRLLLVTNIYAYGPPRAEWIDERHPREPVAFKGRMKLEQECILEAAAEMQWIILRLPDFFGPEAELSYAKMIFDSAQRGRKANLFSPADTPHQFVYTGDVGPVVADLLARSDGWNEAYNFAGSGIITVEEFARRVYQLAGNPYRRRLAGPGIIRLLGLFQPMMREFAEMHYLQSTPVNLTDEKLVRHLGAVGRSSYDDGIAATWQAMQG